MKRLPKNAVAKKIVLELAARAIRDVHSRMQLLSIGHRATENEDIRRINHGPGIEIAPESAVRDAIAAAFNSSKLSHGWAKRHKRKSRWFGVIEWEVPFQLRGNRTELVDLMFGRVNPETGDFPDAVGPLELKRARVTKPDLARGKPEQGRSRIESIANDVRKLSRFVRASRHPRELERPDLTTVHGVEKLHPHVLVWGSQSSDPLERTTDAIFELTRSCGGIKETQDTAWIPLRWNEGANHPPEEIQEWAWVTLLGIKVERAGCGSARCRCDPRWKPRSASDK